MIFKKGRQFFSFLGDIKYGFSYISLLDFKYGNN